MEFNYYELIAISVASIGAIFTVKSFYKKGEPINHLGKIKLATLNSENKATINTIDTVNINVNPSSDKSLPENLIIKKGAEIADSREYKIDSLKSKIQILFIDDDKKFNIVKILKDSGWKKTISVIDVKSIDIPIVKETDIFFVDINGVGKLLGCEFEGLDIALMLKQKYPNKRVIIYSANKNNNVFHNAWDICDFKLEKNALPYQFQALVEKYSLELYS